MSAKGYEIRERNPEPEPSRSAAASVAKAGGTADTVAAFNMETDLENGKTREIAIAMTGDREMFPFSKKGDSPPGQPHRLRLGLWRLRPGAQLALLLQVTDEATALGSGLITSRG